jgi:hypothetical protein
MADVAPHLEFTIREGTLLILTTFVTVPRAQRDRDKYHGLSAEQDECG